jgi:hypothetical protein
MPIPPNIDILTPWKSIEGSPENQSEILSARLQREVPPKHVLHGLKVNAIAIRIDKDDVLFEVAGGEMPLAVVHMTWRKETNSRWPSTKLFRSWEHWVRENMQPAHEEYARS